MGLAKYVKVGGVWKLATTEYVKVAGSWELVTSNYAKVGGDWKAVPIGEKQIWCCENDSNRLYGIDDNYALLDGWPVYGADFAAPEDVACDDEGNSYWACASASGKGVHKIALDGSVVWSDSGHVATVTAICVDAAGNVYWGDAWGRVTMLNSAGGVEWTQIPYGSGVYQVNALAIDYSAGQLYAAYGTAVAGRVR